MIKLYNKQNKPIYFLENISNFSITNKFDGLDILCFDISPFDENYIHISEEVKLDYNGQIYNIKKINERTNVSSIECYIDLDELKTELFDFAIEEQSLSSALTRVLYGTNWTTSNETCVTRRRTVRLENCHVADALTEIADTYECTFRYDTKHKVIFVTDPVIIQPNGTYYTDELNLTSLEFKGDSTSFCTRLYARGCEKEDGTYLTFVEINDGKDYVDNNQYSDKIIPQLWCDERYTDMQSLKNATIEKLKTLAIPTRSYTCKVVDMAKLNEEYAHLTSDMFDVVTLIDRKRKTRINHQIVEYKQYPLEPKKNVVTLSTVSKTVKGTIEKVNTVINDDFEIIVDNTTLNQIKREVDSNSIQITQRYTKGETETVINNIVQQSADELKTEISKIEETNGEIKQDITSVKQTADEIIFKVTDIENNGVNQIKNTTVTINDVGITVGSNTTEMKNKITPSAFEIYRGDEKRINVAPDGTRLQKTIIEDDLTVGSVKIIKRDGLGADFIVV